MKWMSFAAMLGTVAMACHGGRGVTLGQIEAELAAMERRAVERTLMSLFADEEGWLVLPGVGSGIGSPPKDFLGAYRVVAPDSLPNDAWNRFLRSFPSVELLEVSGSSVSPQRTRPVGFRGMSVRFLASGVESVALLLDPAGMRWVAWYEMAHAACGNAHPAALDSLGLEVAWYLAGGGVPSDHHDVPPEALFYPPVPEPAVEPELMWEAALEASTLQLKGLPGELPITPDVALGRRIVFGAPGDPLLNQEPFLLQRRLDALSSRRVVISRARPLTLDPGTYLWAVSTMGQARVVSARSEAGRAGCPGPSAVFFGRPLMGAGTIRVHESGMEADAFPGEYGLSPFSPGCIEAAGQSGLLFFRLGHLLAMLPGPDDGATWPALRTLPSQPPCGWREGPPGGTPAH
ncbi:hypothetical protein JXA88_05025 [Candidatus Fermentibacteria bacterium]|nr:hypothetical protein [Candidatus Fermentibacteria bacterium]